MLFFGIMFFYLLYILRRHIISVKNNTSAHTYRAQNVRTYEKGKLCSYIIYFQRNSGEIWGDKRLYSSLVVDHRSSPLPKQQNNNSLKDAPNIPYSTLGPTGNLTTLFLHGTAALPWFRKKHLSCVNLHTTRDFFMTS